MSTPDFERRTLLKGLVAAGIASLLEGCSGDDDAQNQPKPPDFVQPPTRTAGPAGLLDTVLVTRFADNTINGRTIHTRTYEGMIGGPTLRCRAGQTLRIRVDNQMFPADTSPEPANINIPHHFNTTNLHTHGLHVSPLGNADNMTVEIRSGESFQYEYQIPADHPAGTFMYHPHKHGASSMQSFGGMGGALIIEGGLDDVPEVAAARDLVYLINELNVDPGTGLTPDFTGTVFLQSFKTLTVNGQVRPTLTLFTGEVVRLRVINVTARSTIPFAVDGHELHVLALDGITLKERRATSAPLVLPPGSRADVLIVGAGAGTYNIRKGVDNSGNGADPELILGVLEVLPTRVDMSLPTTLPAPASLPDISASEINAPGRVIEFQEAPTGGPFPDTPAMMINGALFDPDVINHVVALNNVEEWTLRNVTGVNHPFHIHVNPFQVIAINGVRLSTPEWRDTVQVPKGTAQNPGTVTIRTRFRDFAGVFPLHCHILVHQDMGMMQTVWVRA